MTTTLEPSSKFMTAVVKRGHEEGDVSVTTVRVGVVPPGAAKVAVLATGICGTDVHLAHDEYASEPPVVMGHEIVGDVVEVGEGVTSDWVGRRVVCETYFSTCGVCKMCRSGRVNLCVDRRSLGSYEDGGFAEYVVLPAINLHVLPEWVSGEEGALAEPLACICQSLLDPNVVSPGDDVLVTGPGAMGQLAAQVAHASGGEVTLTGLPTDGDRLRVARDLGVSTSVDPVSERSYDVAIECSGNARAASVALGSLRPGGRYVQVGIFPDAPTIPMNLILYKELTVTSGFASTPASWARAIALLDANLVTLRPLVTDIVSLTSFAEALSAAERAHGLKTVVTPRRA